MAVLRVRKATIVADRQAQDELLKAIQTIGQFELTDLADVEPGIPRAEATPVITGVDPAGKARIQQALDTLARYEKKKGGLVETFVDVKYLLSLEEYRQLTAEDPAPLVSRIEELTAGLGHLRDELTRAQAQLDSLAPLREMMIPLEAITPTRRCAVLLGTLPTTDEARLTEELEAFGEVHSERVGSSGSQSYLLIVHLISDTRVAPVLAAHGFSQVAFPGLRGLPLHSYALAEEQVKGLQARITASEDELRQLAEQSMIRLKAVHDGYVAAEQRAVANDLSLTTPHLVVLQGWIIAAKCETLTRVVNAACPTADISFADPEEGDAPPIMLENKPVIEPFQFVTRIYGAPSYSEMDPTPWLAPFFAIFFGVALGDAGYGLITSIFFLVSLRKWKKLTWSGKQMSRLMIAIGLATVVMGALTGGFFGDLTAYLPFPALDALRVRLTLIDPMTNPLGMMIATLVLGIVQVLAGIVAKFVSVVRGGSWKDAILDQGSWLLYLGGFVLYFTASFGVLPKSLAPVLKYVGFAGVLGILLFAGRANRNPLARIGIGLYGLYGTVGYMADVLSYTRLMALGLSGTVIAFVVNQLAFMIKGVPVVGPIIVIGILAGGHLFNLAISAFGAFIHCARLQFVEYFAKFYTGGGRYLKPLRWKGTYTLIREYTE